jgi:hypothetical protein
LARCDLDLSHPKFKTLIGQDQDIRSGLEDLRNKIAKDHRLSNWFNQPMQGYPDYQNKVWKWDFGPEGSTSATRKCWRLYGYVPNPKAAEPIPITAFFCYPKTEDPGGNRTKVIAIQLKKFLTQAVQGEKPENFKRQPDGRGQIVSLCLTCFKTVAHSADCVEIDSAELAHECDVIDIG